MANARLLSLTLERFKSYRDRTVIPFHPLTVILGRNNSGKSTIIQALLLLKQTLELSRPEVPLHLEGYVDALSLRELTYGWPEEGDLVEGPSIGIRWKPNSNSKINTDFLKEVIFDKVFTEGNEEREIWNNHVKSIHENDLEYEIDIAFFNSKDIVKIDSIKFKATERNAHSQDINIIFTFRSSEHGMILQGASLDNNAQENLNISVKIDSFVPQTIPFTDQQPIRRQFALASLEIPIEALKEAITEFFFLGSMRSVPPTLYRPATVPPKDLGASGEYAAQMLQARRGAQVHYLPPLRVSEEGIEVPGQVRVKKLVDAVNDVYRDLGIGGALEIDDIRNAGFRLLFGKANLQHVGRGLSYLLPVVQLGLLADPLRFQGDEGEMSQEEYERAANGSVTHCALEEPEIHLHPKIQSQLAHWFVSLAMAQRQLLVETHSDHLVRRLRGLAARAKPGSDLERWLLENVRILLVDQEDGASTIKELTLTAQGGLEQWPADFMDAATDEEREIFHASLDKPSGSPPSIPGGDVIHDEGEEPETES